MAATPTPASLFDEFEEAFQNCLAPLIKEDTLSGINIDELKTNAEANSQRFLDLAKQMETFFLQKSYLLSTQKPELLLMEEIVEMRSELTRKDELLAKHTEKLAKWQSELASMQARLGTSPNVGTRAPVTPVTPGPVPSPATSSVNQTSGTVARLSPITGAIHSGITPNLNVSALSGPAPLNMPISSHSVATSGNAVQGPMPTQTQMSTAASVQGIGNAGNFPTLGGGPGYPSSAAGQQPLMSSPLAFLEKTTTNIGMPDHRR